MAEDYAVTPQLYQQERRALVTGSNKGGGSLFAIEYSVRQISQTDSEVGFRSIFNNVASRAKARALADRCARGA